MHNKFKTYSEQNQTVNENITLSFRPLTLKIGMFIFIVSIYVLGFIYAYKTYYLKKKSPQASEILIQAPFKIANWKDIGKVSDPVIDLPLKTKKGYKKNTFLLDSGAVISSLPREMASEIGLDLAFLKRIVFVGYGNNESFAYKGEMTVRLGEKDAVLPVVFTQSFGTRSLLGRQGFFDKYIITFNKKRGIIEIRK